MVIVLKENANSQHSFSFVFLDCKTFLPDNLVTPNMSMSYMVSQNLTTIGPGSGLSPVWHQAIT